MSTAPVRRSQRGKHYNYKAGDYIEIVVNDGISIGRLVYQIITSKNSNPRWLVTFDHEDIKDQEICEKSFGKIVEKWSVEAQLKNCRAITTTRDDESGDSAATSDSEHMTNRVKRKVATKENKKELEGSGGNSLTKRKRKTQFKITETTRTKKGRKTKEEVTRVKFRTGTLLLYRGENPRAAFIRKF